MADRYCRGCAWWHEHDAEDLRNGARQHWGECEAAETTQDGTSREESLMQAHGWSDQLTPTHGYLVTHHDFYCCLWTAAEPPGDEG